MPRMQKPRIWRRPFLAALAQSGNIFASCKAAQVSRPVVYALRAEDPVFAQQWDDALEEAIDALELYARSRAIAGSDLLTIFLLKGLRPEKYRERYDVRAKVEDVRSEGVEPSEIVGERLDELAAKRQLRSAEG